MLQRSVEDEILGKGNKDLHFYLSLFARALPFAIARATKLAVKRSMDAGPQYTYCNIIEWEKRCLD
jgi:hypothetical protein